MKPQWHCQSKSGFWHWPSITAVVSFSVLTTAPLIAPGRAAVLETWAFDADQLELTVVLPTGNIPQYFLLAEPARLVLTLPHMELADIGQEQHYAGAIRTIRLAKAIASDGSTAVKIVMEFAPGTVLDPRHAELAAVDVGGGQTRWTVRPLLQSPAGMVAHTSGSMAVETTPAPVQETMAAIAHDSRPNTPPGPSPVPLQGIQTNASILAGVGAAASLDLPASTSIPAVILPAEQISESTPASGTGGTVSAPLVAVPALSEVPEVSSRPFTPLPETSLKPAGAAEVPSALAAPPVAPKPEVTAPLTVDAHPPTAATTDRVEAPLEAAVSQRTPAVVSQPPPFLEEKTTAIRSEQPTIPPPPVTTEGVVPFGTPLPSQAKSLGRVIN